MPNKEIVSLDEIGREILSRWVSLRDPNILYSLTEVNWGYNPNLGEILGIEDERVARCYKVVPETMINFDAWWSGRPVCITFHETQNGHLVAEKVDSAIAEQVKK